MRVLTPINESTAQSPKQIRLFNNHKYVKTLYKRKSICYYIRELGRLTQLVECLLDVEKVRGSSPLSSTNKKTKRKSFALCFFVDDKGLERAEINIKSHLIFITETKRQ